MNIADSGQNNSYNVAWDAGRFFNPQQYMNNAIEPVEMLIKNINNHWGLVKVTIICKSSVPMIIIIQITAVIINLSDVTS